MLNILRYFKSKKKEKVVYKDLIKDIEEFLYVKDLNEKLFSTEARFILINVHYENFIDLLENAFSKKLKVYLLSISLEKFFKTFSGTIDIYEFLNNTLKILKDNKEINKEVQEDLEEILRTIRFILSLGEK